MRIHVHVSHLSSWLTFRDFVPPRTKFHIELSFKQRHVFCIFTPAEDRIFTPL